MTKPPNPYLVLAVATVLPGMGQVMNRQPLRGLTFVFFVLLLGAFTLKTAAPDVSVIGKTAGDSINILARPSAPLTLSVSDNGNGGALTGKVGRGLTNMRARAGLIGGVIDIESTDRGVTVSLTLNPAAAETVAAT